MASQSADPPVERGSLLLSIRVKRVGPQYYPRWFIPTMCGVNVMLVITEHRVWRPLRLTVALVFVVCLVWILLKSKATQPLELYERGALVAPQRFLPWSDLQLSYLDGRKLRLLGRSSGSFGRAVDGGLYAVRAGDLADVERIVRERVPAAWSQLGQAS